MTETVSDEYQLEINKINRLLDKIKDITEGQEVHIVVSALTTALVMVSHYHSNYNIEEVVGFIRDNYKICIENTNEGAH